MKLSVREVLRRARKLLSKRENWTRGTYARNSDNHVCGCDNEAACKFCMLGSLLRVTEDNYAVRTKAERRLETAIKKLFPNKLNHRIANFNDSSRTRHSDVLKVFDKAISLR